jgi:hypothetical protein
LICMKIEGVIYVRNNLVSDNLPKIQEMAFHHAEKCGWDLAYVKQIESYIAYLTRS